MRSQKPVSRVDNRNTHGWFARVYRGDWVGSRSFADRQYGGRENAENAAWDWWKIADQRLPIIPPKPILRRGKVTIRKDPKNPGSKYYDVYTVKIKGETRTWSQKLYFTTLDEQKTQSEKAYRLCDQRNHELRTRYANELAIWYVERDHIMQQILSIWREMKDV